MATDTGLARLLQSDPRFMPAPFTPVQTPGTAGGGFSAAPGADNPGPNGPAYTGQGTNLGALAAQGTFNDGIFGNSNAIANATNALNFSAPVVGEISPGKAAINFGAGLVPGLNTINALMSIPGFVAKGLSYLTDLNAPSTQSMTTEGPVTFGMQGASDFAGLSTLAQGLGITGGQLNSMNQAAPFGNPNNPDGNFFGNSNLGNTGKGNDDGNSPDGTPGTSDGPAGPSDGTPGSAFRTGGTVKKTGPALVHQDEEVVQASEARKPGVRAALKDINRPGTSPLESGLGRLLRRR